MKQPNILVIMADQLKATASNLYGNPFCSTPSLQKLADSGILYQNAFTPHPLCVPARISMWTSQYSHTHGKTTNEILMDPDSCHAFKTWKEMGYTTGLIGKNHCFSDRDYESVFDIWCEISHNGLRGTHPAKGMKWCRNEIDIERRHESRRGMAQQTPVITYAHTDGDEHTRSSRLIADQTGQFLSETGDDPFALWVSFPDPHTPLEAPLRYADRFLNTDIELPLWEDMDGTRLPERTRVLHQMIGVDADPEEHIRGAMAAYYGMVAFLDDCIGTILHALEEYELRDKTIVVFCSDHGDFMGEHRMLYKGGLFYDCMTRIPLIISYPRVIRPYVDDTNMVNLIDIVPTIFSLQDLPAPDSFQGAPLPLGAGSVSRNAAFAEYGSGGEFFTMQELQKQPETHGRTPFIASLKKREAEGKRKMIRTKQWKYIADSMGDIDELYNLTLDPWELTNLADMKDHSDIQMEMKSALLNWCVNTGCD